MAQAAKTLAEEAISLCKVITGLTYPKQPSAESQNLAEDSSLPKNKPDFTIAHVQTHINEMLAHAIKAEATSKEAETKFRVLRTELWTVCR